MSCVISMGRGECVVCDWYGGMLCKLTEKIVRAVSIEGSMLA